MGKNKGTVSAVVLAGVLLLSQSWVFAHPNFHDVNTRALIEAVLRTETGNELARAVLGANVSRFNPGGSQEGVRPDTLSARPRLAIIR